MSTGGKMVKGNLTIPAVSGLEERPAQIGIDEERKSADWFSITR